MARAGLKAPVAHPGPRGSSGFVTIASGRWSRAQLTRAPGLPQVLGLLPPGAGAVPRPPAVPPAASSGDPSLDLLRELAGRVSPKTRTPESSCTLPSPWPRLQPECTFLGLSLLVTLSLFLSLSF